MAIPIAGYTSSLYVRYIFSGDVPTVPSTRARGQPVRLSRKISSTQRRGSWENEGWERVGNEEANNKGEERVGK